MGVKKDVIQDGDSATYPKKGQKVEVHYTGWLDKPNGKKFDSSKDRNKPFQFVIGKGQVIKGWDEGVATMSIGEKAYLTCSPDYAYGTLLISFQFEHAYNFTFSCFLCCMNFEGRDGAGGGLIPANATLVFEVELLRIL